MRSTVIETERPSAVTALGFAAYAEDPLGHDLPEDEPVVTTRRSLVRLAFVAAETAARFQREGVAHDPMAWLLAPRRLFDGMAAVEACLGRKECLRALLLHGLSLGLDATPVSVDKLLEDEALDGDGVAPVRRDGAERRLYTAWGVGSGEGGHLHAFGATMAASAREAAEAMARARPTVGGADLRVFEGFDPSAPLAEALLSPAVANMLTQLAADPEGALGDGLELFVEQRFAA